MKKMIKRLLILCLICLMIPLGVTALAAGDEVILISTPQQLDAIRENLDGHYRLANDINMAGYYEFEPIGNEVDGPFTGILEGAGYTIRNLELRYDSYKYVGLFGYLDGTVTNLTLEDVVVEASRYAGGLAGYADGNAHIEDITVSGSVKAYSQYFSGYAGGIVGYAKCPMTGCVNHASVSGQDYVAGIACYAVDVSDCTNNGSVGGEYAAGIVCYAVDVSDCTNNGSVGGEYAAGIEYSAAGDVTDCSNYGKIRGSTYSYGIGRASNIINCTVRGSFQMSTYSYYDEDYCYPIGYASDTIENCSVISAVTNEYSYTGEVYAIGGASLVKNSYAIISCRKGACGELVQSGASEGCLYYITGSYPSNSMAPISGNNFCVASDGNLRLGVYVLGTHGAMEEIVRKYDYLDYEMNWTRDENWSSGMPIPAHLPEFLELSDIVLILDQREAAQLKARIGTTEVTDLTWTSSDEAIATVNENGLVTAWGEVGSQTVISATTDDGLRMDCLVIIDNGQPTGVTLSPNAAQSLRVDQTLQLSAQVSVLSEKGQKTVTWSSSNNEVATVDQNGLVTAHALGTATITAKTVNGKTASVTVNVTYASDLILETEEIVVPYNKTVYVLYTLTPTTATDSVSATTSNASYVRTGTGIGAAGEKYITIQGYGRPSNNKNAYQTVAVTTTGGVTKTIHVTVVDSKLSTSSYSVNVTKSLQIPLTKYPSDFDQRFTWISSDESIATVDETGTVNGIRPGAVTITATSEYGTVLTCTVTVTNYANEVHTDRGSIHMLKGAYDQVSTWMLPQNCTSTLNYSSSNTNVVTVDAAGKLYAKGTGSAVVTVTTSGSSMKSSFSVTVVSTAVPAMNLEISKERMTMQAGDVTVLSATPAPADTTDSRVTWTSSNEDVATVAPGGVVTAVSAGSAEITATLPNGLAKSCFVSVSGSAKDDISLPAIIAFPGETIQIPVHLNHNPGIAAMRLKVTFDSSILTPNGLIAGDMLSGVTISDNTKSNGVWNIIWSSPTDIKETGTMYTLSFCVSNDVTADSDVEIAVTYEPGDIVNAEHDELSPQISNGLVEVRALLAGDVYEDRRLNSHDILLLQQHLTELVDFTSHQKLSGDMDQDTSITMKDLVSLAQTLVAPRATANVINSTEGGSEPFTITIGSDFPDQDGTVNLPVMFSGCPGISAFKFHIVYDHTIYTLESIDGNSDGISAALMTNLETPGDAVVTWYSNVNQKLNGDVLMLRFRLADGAAARLCEIFLSCEPTDFCRDDLGIIEPILIPGEILERETIASGWSGSIQWTLAYNGRLTIFGEGDMEHFESSGEQPWAQYRDLITSIFIENGVTSIGNHSFSDLGNLEIVTLPDRGLAVIGNDAFSGCSSLISIALPDSAIRIGSNAFNGCKVLSAVFYRGTEDQRSEIIIDTEGTDYLTSAVWHYEITDAIYDGQPAYLCAKCNSYYSPDGTRLSPEHVHEYAFAVTPPTCTENGYTTYTCSCGDSYKDTYVEALGHSFGDWSVTQDPTVTDDGLEERSCSRCGHTEQRTIAKLENPFADVPEGSFYYAPVMWAVENGVTNGVSATEFGPAQSCNRAQVVTFLWAAAGRPEPKSNINPFLDVPKGSFFEKPVLWAVEQGITSGTDATHFSPGAACNRATVVTFLWNAAGRPAVTGTNSFTDVPAGAWYAVPVLWAAQEGITSGVSPTEFGAAAICNRAQVVTFLYKVFAD